MIKAAETHLQIGVTLEQVNVKLKGQIADTQVSYLFGGFIFCGNI